LSVEKSRKGGRWLGKGTAIGKVWAAWTRVEISGRPGKKKEETQGGKKRPRTRREGDGGSAKKKKNPETCPSSGEKSEKLDQRKVRSLRLFPRCLWWENKRFD